MGHVEVDARTVVTTSASGSGRFRISTRPLSLGCLGYDIELGGTLTLFLLFLLDLRCRKLVAQLLGRGGQFFIEKHGVH